MSNFAISPTLNKNKVFILHRSEIEKRLDPDYYHLERRFEIDRLKKSKHLLKSLKSTASFPKIILSENPDNLPYIGLEDIESNTGAYFNNSEKENFGTALHFKAGNVLFPKLRPYLNKVHLAEFDGICSTEFVILDSNKVSPKFLSAFLRSSIVVNQTKHMMSGNTLPRLQTDDIENILVPIADEATQNKVVSIMESALEQKRQNEAAIEKLLASIDDYLLKELGITLPTPPENILKNRIFTSQLSELSGNRFDPRYYQNYFIQFYKNLNKKYSTKKLKEIAEYIGSGSTPTAGGDAYTDEADGVPFIRITNLKNNTVDLTDVLFIKREIHETSLKRTQLKSGELLLSMAGTIGLTVIVPDFICEANINQALARIVLRNGYNNFYIKELLNSKVGKTQTDRLSRPAVQANINFDEIGSLLIPIPPFDKQQEIAKHITAIRKQAQQLKDKTKEELKKASEEIEKILL